MKCDRCGDLLSEYIDGRLSVEDSAELAAHLEDCQSCRLLEGELRKTISVLGGLQAKVPPEDFAESVASQLERDMLLSDAPKRRQRRLLRPVPLAGFGLAAAAALLVVVHLSGVQEPISAEKKADSYGNSLVASGGEGEKSGFGGGGTAPAELPGEAVSALDKDEAAKEKAAQEELAKDVSEPVLEEAASLLSTEASSRDEADESAARAPAASDTVRVSGRALEIAETAGQAESPGEPELERRVAKAQPEPVAQVASSAIATEVEVTPSDDSAVRGVAAQRAEDDMALDAVETGSAARASDEMRPSATLGRSNERPTDEERAEPNAAVASPGYEVVPVATGAGPRAGSVSGEPVKTFLLSSRRDPVLVALELVEALPASVVDEPLEPSLPEAPEGGSVAADRSTDDPAESLRRIASQKDVRILELGNNRAVLEVVLEDAVAADVHAGLREALEDPQAGRKEFRARTESELRARVRNEGENEAADLGDSRGDKGVAASVKRLCRFTIERKSTPVKDEP